MSELRNVCLYGRLGAIFGRKFRLAVETPAEAMKALCVLLHGFEAYMMTSKDRGVGYAVYIDKTNIGKEELLMQGRGDIRIAPVVMGCKRGGIMQIILGTALVLVGTFAATFLGPTVSVFMIKMGYTLIIGGVIQLLSPQPKDPKSKEKAENAPNYAFNGPVNTEAQGHPVPVGYGRMVIGSAVASGGITSSDSVYIPVSGAIAPAPGGTGTGGGGANRGSDLLPWGVLEQYDDNP